MLRYQARRGPNQDLFTLMTIPQMYSYSDWLRIQQSWIVTLRFRRRVSKCRPSWGSRWLWPPSCLASDYLDLSSRLAIAAACQPGSFSITSGLDRNITRTTSTGCMGEDTLRVVLLSSGLATNQFDKQPLRTGCVTIGAILDRHTLRRSHPTRPGPC